MNTPAHVIASCVLLPHKAGLPATSALVVGALLPDLPMFGFYAYQKFLRGRSETEIWSDNPETLGLYFNADWQLFFNWFNSLPLAAAVIAVCWWRGWEWGLLCAASAGLHMLCDLPLHNNDAHAHFLPLSDWKLHSAVSYWDPKHYGRYTLPLEVLLTVAGCVYLLGPSRPSSMRLVGGVTLGIYAAFTGMMLLVWGGVFCRAGRQACGETSCPPQTVDESA